MADTLTINGAKAFRSLCVEIWTINNETCSRLEQCPDTRDYVHMVETVRQSVTRNLADASPEHAAGFLRALADLLSVTVDGGSVSPHDDRDPIEVTELSFSGQLDRLLSQAHAQGATHG